MKKVGRVILMMVVALMFAVGTSQAEKLRCEGVPNTSMNIEWGILYVDIGFGNWDICSIQSIRNNIKPEVCQALYRNFLLAEADGKKVQLSFHADYQTCTDIGDWGNTSLFPYFINFLK